MTTDADDQLLARTERHYDAVPRSAARIHARAGFRHVATALIAEPAG
ncbi:hypothetical protein ACIGXM_27075 [Kitasatospora sp. NPDC052896]